MHIQQRGDHTLVVRELLNEAKVLAVRYYALTGKPLGVTGEVAELEASEKLNLLPAPARHQTTTPSKTTMAR